MEQIKQRLQLLYQQQSDEVFQKLQEIIIEYKTKIPKREKTKGMFFSEQDVLLITYADHVQEQGVKTLQTMQKFLGEYVKGYINKVHFLPFYPYTSDEGFSVIDYYKVKREFGDWGNIHQIGKDFGLMFDFVVNHISQKNEWFQKFLAGDPKYTDYFISFDSPVDTSTVFRPRIHPLLTVFQTKIAKKYVWTTFSEDQIDINFANPDVLLEVFRVLLFYVEHGAEVIRLDAIGYLWKELGTNSIHLPQAHEIVKLMRSVLEEVAPYVWIITETNVPHNDNISYFGSGRDEAHLVYNFTLPPLLLMSFVNQDASKLTHWASSLNYPSDATTFLNFTASHDGIGVTPLKGIVPDEDIQNLTNYVLSQGGRVNYRTVPGQEPQPYELNIVYLSALGGNVDAFLASQAIAMSLRGVPAVYFNSLIGEENWTEGVGKLGSNRAINRRRFDYKSLKSELSNESSKRAQVYAVYKKLLSIRTHEPLFSPHIEQKVLSVHPNIFALIRGDRKEKLLVLVNVTDNVVKLRASKIKGFGKTDARDLISEQNVHIKNDVTLVPYQVMWLK